MEYIADPPKDRDSDFGVGSPDFPGRVTARKILEEARRLAPEVLVLPLQCTLEDGAAIPTPSLLDDLAADSRMSGPVAFLVSVEPPGDKSVRVNLAVREGQVKQIDALAKRFGLSRSAYLIQAGLGQLGNEQSRRRS